MQITSAIQEDFLVFENEMKLSEMIGELRKHEKRSGLVFKKDRYEGLIEKKRLLSARMDSSSITVGKHVHKTPIIDFDAEVIETAYTMFQSDADFLPVQKEKKIIGVLQGLDLLNLAVKIPEASELKVSDVKLLKDSLRKDDPLAKALDLMYRHRLEQIPVVDDKGLFGMISYRDVLRKYLNWSPKRDVSTKFNKMASSRSAEADMPKLSKLPVSNFSTNDNLLMVDEKDSLKSAVGKMVEAGIGSPIVVSGEELLGVLSVKNVLRLIGSMKTAPLYNIKYVGLAKLDVDPFEIENIKKIASNEAAKLQRLVHNEFELVIHIKQYEGEGKRHMFSVNMRTEFPGQLVTSTQEDWDVIKAVRKTFNNAKNKLEKKFKN